MIVTSGKNQFGNLMMGKSTDYPLTIRLGTGSTAENAAQTALIAQVLAQNVTSSVSGSTITLTAVFQSNGATYREVGLFTSGGTMLTRKVISATSFTSGELFTVTFTITLS